VPDAPPFEHVELSDPPYLHQMKAYRRLASGMPQPTLVATGTGSGKTECFLYPLLEHCAATPAPGIKALVIYPMNALAQDQARRFAEEVHKPAGLRSRIRVELYTGDQGSRRGTTAMSAASVITDRATLQRDPPDILLINYRMLDRGSTVISHTASRRASAAARTRSSHISRRRASSSRLWRSDSARSVMQTTTRFSMPPTDNPKTTPSASPNIVCPIAVPTKKARDPSH